MDNKNPRGIVFFDADGTLIDRPKGISTPTPKTMESLKELRDNGYLTGLATGRSLCYLPEGLPEFDCYVTSNGAYVRAGEQEVFQSFIDGLDLAELTGYLCSAGFNYILELQEVCFCKDLHEKWYLDMMHSYGFSDKEFRPLPETPPEKVYKLMITYEKEEMLGDLRRLFENRFEITGQPGNQACDVGKRGVNKGMGVWKALEYLQITGNSYAFGDADNDLGMMYAVGTGIAMGRHTPEIGKTARLITGTVAEEGITCALEELGLIEQEEVPDRLDNQA